MTPSGDSLTTPISPSATTDAAAAAAAAAGPPQTVATNGAGSAADDDSTAVLTAPVSPIRAALRPVPVALVVIGVGVILTIVVLMDKPYSPWFAFVSVAVGAVLAVAKEAYAAVALDRENAADLPGKRAASNGAAVLGVYSAVFGFPGIVAAAVPLIFGN